MSNDNNYKNSADEDVASVEPGDSPSDVESKVLGLDHLSGQPSKNAAEGEKSADSVEGS